LTDNHKFYKKLPMQGLTTWFRLEMSINLSGFVNKKSFTPLSGEQILWDRTDFSASTLAF